MSTPRRFFVEYNLENTPEVFLEGEEFTHAKTVLRVEEGRKTFFWTAADGSIPR